MGFAKPQLLPATLAALSRGVERFLSGLAERGGKDGDVYLFSSFRGLGRPWTRTDWQPRTVGVRWINRGPPWPASRLRVSLDDHTLDLGLHLTRSTGATAPTWCMRASEIRTLPLCRVSSRQSTLIF